MAMHHLNVRVAWHDNRWDGAVCRAPSSNSFCIDLDRIRAERDDVGEDGIAGRAFAELDVRQLPPCKAEAGAFMNEREWWREVDHPYQAIEKAKSTHGHLRRTRIKVPPYSTFAVPFLWMLRSSQERIDRSLPQPLPPDEESPFNSAWVFSRERQEALCELFFGRPTTIGVLAERLQVRHHTAVGLVDRLAVRGLVARRRTPRDRRGVLVELTPNGRTVLRRLARQSIAELEVEGPALVAVLRRLTRSRHRKGDMSTPRTSDDAIAPSGRPRRRSAR